MKTRLSFLWKQPNPTPGYHNVIPDGPGWYRFDGKKWRYCGQGDNWNYDGKARHLTTEMLDKFAVEALEALAEKATE